jgi:predicted transglutaminase-like cysteine proteinase
MKIITIISIFIIIIIILSGIIFIDITSNQKEIIFDIDGDKIADKIDAFPFDPAASLDSDGDGYPDNWNPGKDQTDSTSKPPLIRDECPYDPEEFMDSDGDFVGDNKDAFPYDPEEWSDIDSDGFGDNVDINPYVNLSFEIQIEKFRVIRRVDLFRRAQIYFEIKINGNRYPRIDNNGAYFQVVLNEQKNVNHEKITYEIKDDTKDKYTDIEIIMYDYDFFGFDDIVDISNDFGRRTLKLRFDHIKNEISDTGYTAGRHARLWFHIIFENEISLNQTFYNKKYSWSVIDKQFILPFKIPVNIYKNYQTLNVSRQPQGETFPDEKMAAFVTSKERVIIDLTDELESLKQLENYDEIDKVNYYIRFVQDAVTYRFDNETAGCEEYWKYPVETLVDQHGDCEDTTVLLASILDNLDYDVALLYYSWKEDDKKLGHLALGVNLDGDYGSYVVGEDGMKYFYCETTSDSFLVGEIPDRIQGEPKRIIPI